MNYFEKRLSLCLTMKGLVIKSTGNLYTILLEQGSVKARLRGALRLHGFRSTSPVVVGDYVSCEKDGDDWMIEAVDDRRNYLVRKATNLSREKHILAANIDRLYLVVTLANPSTPLEFIDRVLAAAEAYSVPSTILVNKIDIAPPNDTFIDIYRKAGYEVMQIAATGGVGIEELREHIAGNTVLFSGNSGVGKSSIINALDPGSEARTGAISSSHHKGMHTTTFSEIFPLAGGGYVIDTPGIKGFGLVDMDASELYHHFREIMSVSQECGFYNCTHIHEPNCAVKRAVEDGTIAMERYDSYCKMIDEKEQKYR